MTFAIALTLALSFWHARNVDIPCTPTPVVVQADALPQMPNGLAALAAAYGPPRCQVLIGPALQQWRGDDPGYYATAIIHEVGHIGGVPHSPGGIMDANGFVSDRTEYPFIVRQYIKLHMPWIAPIPGAGYEHRNTWNR